MARRGWLGLAAVLALVAVGAAATPLDELLQRYDPAAAPVPELTIAASVEAAPAGQAVVITLSPAGSTRLIADPGVTVTVTATPGVTWQVALPYRAVDTAREYFAPPLTLRLPFQAAAPATLELELDYAYCVVDAQCFFGEERLTVAAPGS
jgi:hypothetical protein